MKKAILLSFFGTTRLREHEGVIDKFLNGFKNEFTDCDIEICFTSRIVKRILEKKGMSFDDECEAINKLKEAGYKDIRVVSTNIIPGKEYKKLKKVSNRLTTPFISNAKDIMKHLGDMTSFELKDDEEFIYVGHGTDHIADRIYEDIDEAFRAHNDKYHMMSIEGELDLDSVIENLSKDTKTIYLRPFMLVSGVHMLEDIASDDEDSIKSRLEALGYEVKLIDKGLGEEDYFLNDCIEKVKAMEEPLLNIVGVGPGDEDLLTVKAILTLKNTNAVFVLDNRGRNLALDTVMTYVDDKPIIKMPFDMKSVTDELYNELKLKLEEVLAEYRDVSFITIGDAAVFSTPMNLTKILDKKININLVNGMPSFVALTAMNLDPLIEKGESLVISDNTELVEAAKPDRAVILKAPMNKDAVLKLKDTYEAEYFKRISMPNEMYLTDEEEIRKDNDYISLFYLKKRK
ncbi:MAG: sirohydrochlorin cobaltochelatase [Eubacteriales bacterium]|uniref:sirohydrochlorin cobaltochelatase n=1 Tax=Fenollaria sp. TaxID=1965292 RepID=UPI002A7520F8|nr:sirohydrochlorin cobaltochelatase [Fenollaria sp.]MDD7340316.1 sirohydrochlorin cobaltochelatase [Eubacteriales bacterium]MDY3106571.1 sirohydrochlorin cobaltochelatase [Fenollaria sp.]